MKHRMEKVCSVHLSLGDPLPSCHQPMLFTAVFQAAGSEVRQARVNAYAGRQGLAQRPTSWCTSFDGRCCLGVALLAAKVLAS